MAEVGGVGPVATTAATRNTEGVVGQGGVQDAAKARTASARAQRTALADLGDTLYHGGAQVKNFLQAAGDIIGMKASEALGRPEAAKSYEEAGKAASQRQDGHALQRQAAWSLVRLKSGF